MVRNPYSFLLLNTLSTAMLLMTYGTPRPILAQQSVPYNSTTRERGELPDRMGRLYVFREVRSFGAHIDDYVTVNGLPVHRIPPGAGFYCDLHPGSYVIDIARHNTDPLTLSIAAGQRQYVCVMLHTQAGVAPRSGALTSDQSFDVRLVEPTYGAQRVREYSLTEAQCQR